MRAQHPAVEVLCSYAPEDEQWLRKLEAHLRLLKLQGLLSLWHNQRITAGTDWQRPSTPTWKQLRYFSCW